MLCVLFCFYSLSLSSSAVGEDLTPVFPLTDDFIDAGYLSDGNGNYYLPEGINDPLDPNISFNLATEKEWPNFSPDILPWTEMPDYIQDIVYMEREDWKRTETEYIVPFVLVRVRSVVEVFVGTNVSLGRYNNVDGTVSLFRIDYHSYLSDNSVCYMATYNHDGDLEKDWTELTPYYPSWTSMDRFVMQYSPTTLFNMSTGTHDYYIYGANATRVNISSQTISPSSTDGDLKIHFRNAESGFEGMMDSLFLYSDQYTLQYFEYFKPKSIEDEDRETQKGIWETLKSIPDMIAEKFKGLFIPSDNFFDLYVQEIHIFFVDRFGLLYELPDAFIDILQQLVDYKPAEEGYYIDFPEVVMPVLDGGEWSDVVLIEETQVKFEFLDEGPIATLYSMYRSALWLIFIFLLINLMIHKANKVFGGGSS